VPSGIALLDVATADGSDQDDCCAAAVGYNIAAVIGATTKKPYSSTMLKNLTHVLVLHSVATSQRRRFGRNHQLWHCYVAYARSICGAVCCDDRDLFCVYHGQEVEEEESALRLELLIVDKRTKEDGGAHLLDFHFGIVTVLRKLAMGGELAGARTVAQSHHGQRGLVFR